MRIELVVMAELVSTWIHSSPEVATDEHTFDFIMVIGYFLLSKSYGVIEVAFP